MFALVVENLDTGLMNAIEGDLEIKEGAETDIIGVEEEVEEEVEIYLEKNLEKEVRREIDMSQLLILMISF